MRSIPRFGFVTVLALVGTAAAPKAAGGMISTDFSSPPAGITYYGAATVTDGYLRLTPASTFLEGYAIVANLDGGRAISGFSATFDMCLWGGSGADGLAFSFAGDTGPGNQEGAGSGLRISWDTYQNGEPDDAANVIDVFYGANRLGRVTPQDAMRQSQFLPVTVNVDAAGLDLTFAGHAVYTDLAIPGWNPQPGWQFELSAATGQSTDNQMVDNLTIHTVPEPASLVLLTAGLAMILRRWRLAA